jgi:hypothetical protein
VSDTNGQAPDPQRVGNLITLITRNIRLAAAALDGGNVAGAVKLVELIVDHPIGAEYTHDIPPDVGDALRKMRARDTAQELRNQERAAGDGPPTWETFDLGPILAGDTTLPEPDLGLARQDGVFMLYRGREHVVIGSTESGKTWFACACAARELRAGNRVVYIHYEEPGKLGAVSTVERLIALGVDKATLGDTGRFRFVGPTQPVRTEWLAALLDFAPALVVHDGVNEAMALHGDEIIRGAEGASDFRRRLVVPCLEAGAATLATDHLPRDATGRADAYGTVHKGNALNGARFLLENKEPFGRGARGRSYLSVTKDRPGYLRGAGVPDTEIPGKAYLGTFIVDASDPLAPLEAFLSTPKPEDVARADAGAERAAAFDAFTADVWQIIAAQPARTVTSRETLYSALRKTGRQFANTKVNRAVADLLRDGRLEEVFGARNAKGYRATTSSEGDCQ